MIECWCIKIPRVWIRQRCTSKGEVAKPGRYPLTTNMYVEDLIRVAGGLKRSADPVKADLTRYGVGTEPGTVSESVPIELSAALKGDGTDNIQLRDGDMLSIRQAPGWNDVGAAVDGARRGSTLRLLRNSPGRAVEFSAGACRRLLARRLIPTARS